MNVVAICNGCKEVRRVEGLTVEDWRRYINGELVQNVWPDFNDSEREAIMGCRTGVYTCDACWDELFAHDDEEY